MGPPSQARSADRDPVSSEVALALDPSETDWPEGDIVRRLVDEARMTADWGALLALVEQRWESLLESSLEDAHLILSNVSTKWFESFPRAMLVARIVVPGRDFPVDASEALAHGGELADWTLMSVDARLRGDVAGALALALEAEPAANALMVHEHLLPDRGVRSYFMQAGVSHLLAGEIAAAQRCLIRVAGSTREGEHVGQRRDALGKLAFTAAISGDVRRARTLINESAGLEQRPGWMGPLAESTRRTSEALVRLEELDRAGIDLAPSGIAAESLGDEFWFGGRVVRAGWALAWGNPAVVLLEMRDDHAVRFTSLGAGSLAATVMAACEAEVLIAIGQGSDAAQLLAGVESRHPMLQVSRGRLQLLRGQDDDALGELAPVIETAHPWVRARMEALILAARAHHHLGRPETAVELVRQALATGELTGLVTPWALLGDRATSSWAAEVTELAPILDRLDLAGVRAADTRALTIAVLSVREREVLIPLADGLSFTQIARWRFVSRNTVKSQVRAIYRKLGVSSLSEAIAKGYQLGQLR